MILNKRIRKILDSCRTVAVVGLSRDPKKDSYKVSSYLQDNGFKIIPVNPFVTKILGEKSWGSLLEIPIEIQETIEIVVIFRPSKFVPKIIEEAIKLRENNGLLYVIWMQLGIINNISAKKAEKSGFTVVMNRCIMIEHSKLFEKKI
jgi:predicted CoA-binding protein